MTINIDIDIIKDKMDIIFKLKEEVKNDTGINIFDNYAFRELGLSHAMNCNDQEGEVGLLPGRTGADFVYNSPKRNICYGEMKSFKISTKFVTAGALNKGLEFDKQNDPQRRLDTLKYDGFVVGMFHESAWRPLITFSILGAVGVGKVLSVIKEKQTAAVALFEQYNKEGKRITRDSIVVTINNLLDVLADEDMDVFYGDTQITISELIDGIACKRFSNKSFL